MKTNSNFLVKSPTKTKISLFFTNHYFKNRAANDILSSTRAINNITINNIKSIIKNRLDTLVKNKGRYLFSLYTDNSHTEKAYFLIVSENKERDTNSLNFAVVTAGTSSNLWMKFTKILHHNRFFISDFTCEDLINQENKQNKIREEKFENMKSNYQVNGLLPSLNTSTKKRLIKLVERTTAINNNQQTISKIVNQSPKEARTYRSTTPDNYFSQIENRFLSIENRLKRIKVSFNLSNTLSLNYLDYLVSLLTKFAKLSLSEGSYKNILTTTNNLRSLLVNKVAI